MKPKNKIKLFDKAIELVKLLIQLENRQSINLNKSIPKFTAPNTGNYLKGKIINSKGETVLKNVELNHETERALEFWNITLNKHLKEKGLNNSQPFAHPIKNKEPKIDADDFKLPVNFKYAFVRFNHNPRYEKYSLITPTAPHLGFNHDFHKGMIEAEKELNKVCKEIEIDCKCNGENSIHNIFSFEFNNIQVRQKKCFDCGKITVTHRY